MQKETIIILSHVNFDNSPYCLYVHNHAKALQNHGYNVIVFANLNWLPFISLIKKNRKKFYKEYKGEKNIDGVKVVYSKQLSFSNLLYSSKINLNGISYYLTIKNKIKKIINENNVIMIDAHTFKVEGYVACKLKKKYKLPTFITCHGTSLEKNLHTKNGIKQIQKFGRIIDKYICVSKKIENSINKLKVYNTETIYNGINSYNNEELSKQKFTIISVGNLIKQKNFDISIKAISELKNKYKGIELIIVGDGPEKKNLVKLAETEQLQNNVKFMNSISNEDVHKLMKKSNIFILPSVREGFGIVYAEAMGNKCITIGTKGEGIDGLIINEKNGFLINADSKEIERLITDIYDGKYNLEEIRKQAYITAKELTWDNNAKNYLKNIEQRK